MGQESLVAYIWTVTGWHRHVGQVSDYVADPDIVSISWVEGERAARPKQVLLAGSIDVFTGMPQPKLIEDYTHIFQHSCRRFSEALSFVWKTSCVQKKEQAQAHWRSFQKNLMVVNNTVAARNEERARKGDITNDNGSPSQIELQSPSEKGRISAGAYVCLFRMQQKMSRTRNLYSPSPFAFSKVLCVHSVLCPLILLFLLKQISHIASSAHTCVQCIICASQDSFACALSHLYSR